MKILDNNLILNHFGVNSYKEVLEFMEENPEDEKTLELKSLIDMMGESKNDTNWKIWL